MRACRAGTCRVTQFQFRRCSWSRVEGDLALALQLPPRTALCAQLAPAQQLHLRLRQCPLPSACACACALAAVDVLDPLALGRTRSFTAPPSIHPPTATAAATATAGPPSAANSRHVRHQPGVERRRRLEVRPVLRRQGIPTHCLPAPSPPPPRSLRAPRLHTAHPAPQCPLQKSARTAPTDSRLPPTTGRGRRHHRGRHHLQVPSHPLSLAARQRAARTHRNTHGLHRGGTEAPPESLLSAPRGSSLSAPGCR